MDDILDELLNAVEAVIPDLEQLAKVKGGAVAERVNALIALVDEIDPEGDDSDDAGNDDESEDD